MKEDGTVKLCDFGIAKVVIGKTYTFCGTPEYLAPEMISQKGHGISVDWWAFGIFLHELLCGVTPFSCASPVDTYKEVMRGIEGLSEWNPALSADQRALLVEILQETPSRRLLQRPNGFEELKARELYAGFAWDDLGEDFPVPYTPEVDIRALMKRTRLRDVMALQKDWYGDTDDTVGWDDAF
jgi:serine/threonine protein kinase